MQRFGFAFFLCVHYRLVLQASDKGTPPLSSTATVRVQVVDVNDNSPVIPAMDPAVIAESESLVKLVYTKRLK